MRVVAATWLTRAQIAEACCMTVSSQFSAILTNLAEREWIESGHFGYRLPPLGGVPSAETADGHGATRGRR